MISKTKVAAWLAGDATEADFEQLYRVELPRIYNFFRYRVGDESLAEDLTSETFEKAWRNRHRYRKDLAGFSTWLFTIARRTAIDHFRRHRPAEPLDSAQHLSTGQSPEDMVQERFDLARLSTLLAQCSDRDRELVALKYGAGLTNRTIAGLTGLSESNVGTILHRLVKRLRAEWEVQR
jgi:RNA polymerase sigma-70 factor (ECF subfamily)